MIYNMTLGKSFIVSFRLRSSIKGEESSLTFHTGNIRRLTYRLNTNEGILTTMFVKKDRY